MLSPKQNVDFKRSKDIAKGKNCSGDDMDKRVSTTKSSQDSCKVFLWPMFAQKNTLPGQSEAGLGLNIVRELFMDSKAETTWSAASVQLL